MYQQSKHLMLDYNLTCLMEKLLLESNIKRIWKNWKNCSSCITATLVQIVAINDLLDVEHMDPSLKYDSETFKIP